MQQDAEDDEQDSDNEFPESDEMNQPGFSGEISIPTISINIRRGTMGQWLGRRT